MVSDEQKATDKSADEFLGLVKGIVADDILHSKEIEFLRRWIVANAASRGNPLVAELFRRIDQMLSDGKLNDVERATLFDELKKFAGSEFDFGEAQTSTNLPLDEPPPEVIFMGQRFCLTGEFTFGRRKNCEEAIRAQGGNTVKEPTQTTDFLVIAHYGSSSWVHTNFGRKIEKAVKLRANGYPIKIISEAHWRSFLPV